MRYQCPCCGFFTYPVPPKKDAGFICSVCFWENDPFLRSEDDPSDSNHGVTLAKARENYREFGACEERMKQHVRAPREEEMSEKGKNNPIFPIDKSV